MTKKLNIVKLLTATPEKSNESYAQTVHKNIAVVKSINLNFNDEIFNHSKQNISGTVKEEFRLRRTGTLQVQNEA